MKLVRCYWLLLRNFVTLNSYYAGLKFSCFKGPLVTGFSLNQLTRSCTCLSTPWMKQLIIGVKELECECQHFLKTLFWKFICDVLCLMHLHCFSFYELSTCMFCCRSTYCTIIKFLFIVQVSAEAARWQRHTGQMFSYRSKKTVLLRRRQCFWHEKVSSEILTSMLF